MKDEQARRDVLALREEMDRFQDEAMTAIAKEVAPLAEVLRQVQASQRGMANATRGQIESLQRAVKPMQENLAKIILQVETMAAGIAEAQRLSESASQDANSARVDVTGMLEVVQDIQDRLNKQKIAVVQVLTAMEV